MGDVGNEAIGWRWTEHKDWENKPANLLYRVKSQYMALCGQCGRSEFTGKIRSHEGLQEMKDRGWVPYQDGEEWRLRCPECAARGDVDPQPEALLSEEEVVVEQTGRAEFLMTRRYKG